MTVAKRVGSAFSGILQDLPEVMSSAVSLAFSLLRCKICLAFHPDCWVITVMSALFNARLLADQ